MRTRNAAISSAGGYHHYILAIFRGKKRISVPDFIFDDWAVTR